MLQDFRFEPAFHVSGDGACSDFAEAVDFGKVLDFDGGVAHVLNRIDEGFLRLVKNNDAQYEGNEGEGNGVAQCLEGKAALAQEPIAEGFYNSGHGVEFDDPFVGGWGRAEGVDDSCGVHHELDAEGDQKGEVAVFRGEGGDDEAQAEAQ